MRRNAWKCCSSGPSVAERYWKTHDTVSPDAAWHAFRGTACGRTTAPKNGAFRKSELFESYPESIPRAIPSARRPDVATCRPQTGLPTLQVGRYRAPGKVRSYASDHVLTAT
jgi:hypothetical protein